MASDVISMPLQQLPLLGRLVYEIEATLDIRNDSGAFVPVPFLFDTGTHFTTIPIALANQLDVPFDTNNPVGISGTTGASSGYMSPLWFSFPALPQWQFECWCCFTPHNLKRALLCLTDVLTHFSPKTHRRTRAAPHGSLRLQLRKGHKGKTRS